MQLTFGVGLPMMVALSNTGVPFFTFSCSNGTITFGGSIWSKSSFFGGGALTSSGPNCSGNAPGPFFGSGLTVNLQVVSSLPTGLTARTV